MFSSTILIFLTIRCFSIIKSCISLIRTVALRIQGGTAVRVLSFCFFTANELSPVVVGKLIVSLLPYRVLRLRPASSSSFWFSPPLAFFPSLRRLPKYVRLFHCPIVLSRLVHCSQLQICHSPAPSNSQRLRSPSRQSPPPVASVT